MTEIEGELRIVTSAAASGVNTPGSVRLVDDGFTAMWMDPLGTLAAEMVQDPDMAREMFLQAKGRLEAKQAKKWRRH